MVESHGIMGKGKDKYSKTGDSRNKTRPAKVRVVANSKQKVFSWTHNVESTHQKNLVMTVH